MKLLATLIVAILMVSCQSDLKKKESEEAYKKGIETLEKLLVDGQPDYQKAKEYFSRATQLNPNNIKAQYWKAHTELNLAEFDETYITATNALGKSKSKHSLRLDFLVFAGLSSKKLGKNGDEYFREATKIYEKRINRNINDIDAIANKSIILCYMDKKNDAIEFLNSLSLNEDNQALLEQIKIDIQTFDTEDFLNQVTIEKQNMCQ